MDITDLVKIFADHRQIPAKRRSHPPKNQAFSRIIQNRFLSHACFLENPVCQPSKAEHVNIHDPSVAACRYQIHLGLHGKLIRYQK